MKKKLFFAAVALVALASCSDNEFIGDNSPTTQQENAADEIQFGLNVQNTTRAGELVGATAAEKLGRMFVVEGTKGSEQTNSPSKTVVFDNYLVGYEYNSAGKTEDNTNNWEYVGKQAGITDRMTAATWSALHSGDTDAKAQSIKYWDYSVDQYDFIAWSTGNREAVSGTPTSGSSVQVTRINTGSTLATNGFTMTALSAADLKECYYTDIITAKKADNDYGKPVTLTFRNMAAKVRVALYETVPGYSIKDVQFYTSDANPATPTDLAYDKGTNATLFTMGDDALPQSGAVTVKYPHIGTTYRDASPAQTKDYNKASVSVAPGTTTSTTQAFGALNYTGKESSSTYEAAGNFYLGRTLPTATFAGDAENAFYTAVIPNTNGYPLTLRLNYTLVATDGSGETIKIYGAKAVVPATYTVWQPNYAYTYIFKISDNTNGWTSQTNSDPKGLFPITFDAVVTSFTDANAEQTTITTVATPSITTYQQGHIVDVSTTPYTAKDEYSKNQKAGVDQTNVKNVYVQVMDNSGATPSLVNDLDDGNSLLFKITKDDADYQASEAEVIDALQNRTNLYSSTSPEGRNGIKLTKNGNIANDVDEIVNGVDDQPISITAGEAAEIVIGSLDIGTYAYVYVDQEPTIVDEKIYNVVAATSSNYTDYYAVSLSATGTETPLAAGSKAEGGRVYFVKNVDANGDFVSYTFKQTKVNDDVAGLVAAIVPGSKATTSDGFSATAFYFDVYNQNNGKYAVKVIKVVN